MDELEAAAVGRGSEGEEECPLCLGPLGPFWDVDSRAATMCCGQDQCRDCYDKRGQYLSRAVAAGTFGRGEVQLQSKCSFCRTQLPKNSGEAVSMMLDNLEKGRLPLRLHKTLGLFYKDGNGVERNEEKAVEIWRLGAEKGDPQCQGLLGSLYHNGLYGLQKCAEEAKRWCLAATEQGNALAEFDLALMGRNEGNDAEYLKHLQSSATKGYVKACYRMSKHYYIGECGLKRSEEGAIRWATPGAERGDVDSMGLLGAILCEDEEGQRASGDNPDFTEGMHLLRRAGDQWLGVLREIEKAASNKCFMCNSEAPPENEFLRCSRCRAAWYCSKDCQVQHWKAEEGGHKQFCIKWTKEAEPKKA